MTKEEAMRLVSYQWHNEQLRDKIQKVKKQNKDLRKELRYIKNASLLLGEDAKYFRILEHVDRQAFIIKKYQQFFKTLEHNEKDK